MPLRGIVRAAVLLACFLAPALARAQDPISLPEAPPVQKPELAGFVDVNLYYDTRRFATTTLNTLVRLPARFQYFAFINMFAPLNSGAPTDVSLFYTEQNLRWNLHASVPLDASLQWVLRSGEANDMLRVGVIWRVSSTPVISRLFAKISLFYSLAVHGYQLDFVEEPGWRWQLEHVYKIGLFAHAWGDRAYLAGFLDHNLWVGGGDARPFASRVVTEHQLGVRLVGGLHVVAEYRFNEYSETDQHGAGFGLQYVMKFTTTRREDSSAGPQADTRRPCNQGLGGMGTVADSAVSSVRARSWSSTMRESCSSMAAR